MAGEWQEGGRGRERASAPTNVLRRTASSNFCGGIHADESPKRPRPIIFQGRPTPVVASTAFAPPVHR